MAEIVAGFGVPHTPAFPAMVVRNGPGCAEAKLYREVARHLDAVRPDVLVVFSNDHFNTFFLDNFPTFAIGVAERTFGPNDQTPMPAYTPSVHLELATFLREDAIVNGFDLTLSEEFSLDHSFMVPLHFLTPSMRIPIVPVFVNGFIRPLPSAQRCHALGRAIAAAIKKMPSQLRVAAMGSGSFSLEIGGPRIALGERTGVPDPDWAVRVQDHLEQGRIDALIAEATPAQLWRAGNAGGEVLNWIAMLGVVGARKPCFMERQIEHGHAYGVWRD